MSVPASPISRSGDRVVYACEPVGAYAQIRTMPAPLVIPLPADIDDETAAAIFLKGLAVEFMLHTIRPIRAGEVVLVHAAAGGMGLLLCQWARALGADVIGTVSSDDKAERALAAGCARAIVYTREDFVSEVLRLTGGRGADVIYDGVGAETFGRSLDALAVRGHLISFGQASGPVGEWDIGAMAAKSATISRPNFGHYTTDPEELPRMADRCSRRCAAAISGRPSTAACRSSRRRRRIGAWRGERISARSTGAVSSVWPCGRCGRIGR